MDIQPQFLSFIKLVTGRLFVIPKYQRAYSWTPKQISDLFSDIEKVHAKDSNYSHFMSTVVGLRQGDPLDVGTDQYNEIEVVDGQQRLTTLTILLKAISKALTATNASERRTKAEIENLLVKEDDVNLLLLQTNHDSSQMFVDYLRSGTLPDLEDTSTDADRNLAIAMMQCEEFVAAWSVKKSILELYSLLKNRLTFIFHEVSDEALVYSVFEVLNSRGLDVVWFDKLKSLLMGDVFEHSKPATAKRTIKELHTLWGEIYEVVGLQRGLSKETLRFCSTLYTTNEPNKTLSEESSTHLLVEIAEKKPKKAIEVTKWLLETVRAEKRLLDNKRVSAASKIVQARLVAVSIILRGFSKPDETLCLNAWEKVTFKIFALSGKDSRNKVGDYVRLAWRIANQKLAVAEIIKELKELGSEFKIKEAAAKMSGIDCYTNWTEELRYLLYRYDEYLAAAAGQTINKSQWNKIWAVEPSTSIEHIQPQSKGNPSVKNHSIFVHRLGNLTMLPPGTNSSLRDKDPKDKAQTYKVSGLIDTAEIGRDIETKSWNLAAVEKREKRMIAWIAKEWS